jgi:hypothetical protein
MLRDQQILQRRHATEEADILKSPRHPGPRDPVTGQAVQCDILPAMVQGQAPLGRSVEAGDAVEHRGLAGAIRADDGSDGAPRGGEGNLLHRGQAAEAHGQLLDCQDRRH